jgi:hypothetical protein
MKLRATLSVIAMTGVLAGCASSSSILVGKARPAISPAQVKLYLKPPQKFEEIALLESSSKASVAFSDQGKMDLVIERMKEQAAKVGANGVLLRGTTEQQGMSIGTGGFTGSVGLGTSVGLTNKVGNGVAIYVELE